MTIIIFDGPTACGKTTLLDKVNGELTAQGINVVTIPEHNAVRNLINQLQIGNIIRSKLPPITESLFWTMNQVYRVETEFPENKQDVVLVDRYIYTPIVYQYIFLKDKGTTLQEVVKYISRPFGLELPTPDVTFVPIPSFQTLEGRFRQREKRQMSQLEINLTKEAIDLYTQLGNYFNNYFLLDADRSVEAIFADVEYILSKKNIGGDTVKR